MIYRLLCTTLLLTAWSVRKNNIPSDEMPTLFRNITLIDGNGGPAIQHTDLLVEGNRIAAIGAHLSAANARVVDLTGKSVMPCLISTHVHIGTLRGTTNNAGNYTRDNILSQLKKYLDYGVCAVQVMGSDEPMMFNGGLRDSSQQNLLPGATIFSAGYGFGAPMAAPPKAMGMDYVFRPGTEAAVDDEMDSLALVHPSVVKMWVDDFNGRFQKMDPDISLHIISEAHKHHLRVASHLYYLSDARKLVAGGLDIFAHGVRDSLIDDALIAEMKEKNVSYIPTLSLDEYAFIYSRKPSWIDDAFFRKSLEPGVYEMISSAKYQNDLKNSPLYKTNVRAFETAMKNLKKLYEAGILIALGTDSGATPVRAQGFSEHLELELLVQAGLTPVQAIRVGTRNASELLQISDQWGTLDKGKLANFMVLTDNPATDIRNTRKIEAVYKGGLLVSRGPVNQ